MKKIMCIGFGYEPFWSGGMVQHQETVMKELVDRGYDVSFFCGGDYDDVYRKVYLKKWNNNDGIRFFELRNSPNYPINKNLLGQCDNTQLEEIIREVINSESPDIIHLRDIRMFTASIIDLINELNIPSVKSMHNYFDICPQGERLFKGKENCPYIMDFKKCAECITALPQVSSGLQKRVDRFLSKSSFYPQMQKIWRPIKDKRKSKKSAKEMMNFDAMSEQCKYRVNFFIERLQKIDLIHCNTSSSAEIFIKYGVPKEKIRVIPPSTEYIEIINPKPVRDTSLPIVFGFTGGTILHKGFHILMEAFSMLDQNRAKLRIYGNCNKNVIMKWQHLNVDFCGKYSKESINDAFSEIDVGLFPSIWEETFGLIGVEFISARIPVIASDIGGVRDWLHDGENGFLVEPNNAQKLSECMAAFIEKPGLISEIQKKMKPWKASKKFADEMLALYEEASSIRYNKLDQKVKKVF